MIFMKKIIRLTESDLNRMVKRIIREQSEEAVMDAVIHSPRIEHVAEKVVSEMSPKELNSIKNAFSLLGVSPSSSFSEVKSAVENLGLESNDSEEMTEQEKMSTKKKLWHSVKVGLLGMGIINAGLFFTPFSMIIDKLLELDPSNQDSMEVSFMISALLIIIGGRGLGMFDDAKKRN